MTGLNGIGVPTHFIKRINMREQLIRSVEIIPLEVVVRNVAAGSMSQASGHRRGHARCRARSSSSTTRTTRWAIRWCTEEHIIAFGWAGQQDLDDMVALALRVNDFMSGVMLAVGIKLVDFKIEIGRDLGRRFPAADRGRRDQPGFAAGCGISKRGQKLDKDVFRRDLGNLADAYTEVARRLGVLPTNVTHAAKPHADQLDALGASDFEYFCQDEAARGAR